MAQHWWQPQLWASLAKSYSPKTLIRDLNAGYGVAILAMPLCLAIAIASGVPPLSGLATTIIGGALISAFGGTKHQIGGPAAAFIVVVAGVVSAHGINGLLAATMTAGILLIIAAILGLGSLIRHVPHAVLMGFTSAIGVVIAINQLKEFAGIEAPLPSATLAKLAALWNASGQARWQSIAVGVTTILVMLSARRFAPRLPGLALAVIAGSLLAHFIGQVATITGRFGTLPSTLPAPALPSITQDALLAVLPTALLLTFLIGVESLMSASIAEAQSNKRDGINETANPNAELLGQGLANIASPLFGGLPATGVIARTAANIEAGAATPLAGVFHAGFIALALWLMAPVIGQMALPCLAGALLVTAWRLLEIKDVREVLSHGSRRDKLALSVTWILTIVTSLEFAISAGLAVAFLMRSRVVGRQQVR